MEIPNNIKHFLWRVTRNSHPLRANLAFRGMDVESSCIVCNKDVEDEGHLYFKYSVAKHFWAELGVEEQRERLAGIGSTDEAVWHILGLNKEIQCKMAVGMWAWWSERNGIGEEGKRRPISLVSRLVECYVREVMKLMKKEVRSGVPEVKAWRKPDPEGQM